MYPMDFEEWLWANGIKDIHFNYLKQCLSSEEPVEEAAAPEAVEAEAAETVDAE